MVKSRLPDVIKANTDEQCVNVMRIFSLLLALQFLWKKRAEQRRVRAWSSSRSKILCRHEQQWNDCMLLTQKRTTEWIHILSHTLCRHHPQPSTTGFGHVTDNWQMIWPWYHDPRRVVTLHVLENTSHCDTVIEIRN